MAMGIPCSSFGSEYLPSLTRLTRNESAVFTAVLNLFSLEIFVTFYRFFIPTGGAVTLGTAVDVPRPAAGTHTHVAHVDKTSQTH
jgi:hypothetical protein